jgi:cytochrome P450
MHIQTVLFGILALVVARVAVFLYQSLTSPLRKIPGPFWTRFTRLWFFNRVRLGKFEHDNIALHQKYGAIVRVAPDMYSINSPDAVKQVYGIGTKFTKSDWYEGWKHPSPDRWTLFPDRDMNRHAETRKRFQGMYSMSSLVSYEGYVDECAKIFGQRLTEFSEKGDVIDMGHWFQCYAFDVIGDITYSQRFGFLDKGEDIADVMAALQNAMIYSTLIGIYAKLHPIIFDFMTKFKWSGAGGRVYIMQFVQQRIDQRNKERNETEKSGQDLKELAQKDENAPQDFLEKLMVANKEDPQKVTSYHIFMMGLSNIIAGSDTTAVSLSSILYHLLQYPVTMKKLRDEIDVYTAEGRCGYPNVTFAESQGMPYLQAVMKEALRMHSATGLPLWRVVPEGGAEICGQLFPGGTVIGLNTWCAHYNESVFGKDAKEFRPERWIEAEKEGGEKLKSMDAFYMPVSHPTPRGRRYANMLTIFQFGLGSRTCLGRHISILEMSKLIPQLVREFDFELERPHEEWDTGNYWFVKPTNFRLKVKVRAT